MHARSIEHIPGQVTQQLHMDQGEMAHEKVYPKAFVAVLLDAGVAFADQSSIDNNYQNNCVMLVDSFILLCKRKLGISSCAFSITLLLKGLCFLQTGMSTMMLSIPRYISVKKIFVELWARGWIVRSSVLVPC